MDELTRDAYTKTRPVLYGVVVPTLAMMKKRKANKNNQGNMKMKMKKEGIFDIKQEEKKIAVKADPELDVEVLSSAPSNQSVLVDDNQTKETKEDFKKLALLKNPKLKRNDALAFLPQTLRNRLLPIGLEIQDQFFTIDQVTREVLVTRLFISKIYGGNCQQTFSHVSKAKFEKHGMSGFLFMIPTLYQPEAPQLPGSPGLWINYYRAESTFTERVFVKIVNTMYQYQGIYDGKPADPPYLTVEEYFAQTQKFRDTWAKAILSESWGTDVVIRVFLRKELKREPTEIEIQRAHQRYPQYRELISIEDIKAAYALGEEMGVWTMKCVGYENGFQREMSEKYPNWQANMNEEQKRKKKEKKDNKKPAKSKATGSLQTKAKTMTKKSTKGKSGKLKEDSDSAESSDGLDASTSTTRSSQRKREQPNAPIVREAVAAVAVAAAEESSDGLEYVDDPSTLAAAREVIELSDSDSDYSLNKGARLSPIIVD